jgi:hypothetical protein
MEPLVFAIVAMRTLYNLKEPFVPEPLDFRPIDLRALRHFYETDDDSWSVPADRQEPLVPQIAS